MATHRTLIVAVTFLGFLVPAGALGDPQCAGFDHSEHTGNIAHEAVDEASGLAASWRHEGLFWTHNDSGDEARLFLLRADGSHVATVLLAGLDKPTDWEDIAVGPCEPPSDNEDSNAEDEASKPSPKSCVYVGDIGDNRAHRDQPQSDQVGVHRFEEPALPDQLPADVEAEVADTISFRYPDGARDAETLMVHPHTAAIYVIDKQRMGAPSLYRIPRRAQKAAGPKEADQKEADQKETNKQENEPPVAVEIGQLSLGGLAGFANMITAGDISPAGDEFTVRTYLGVYTFCADGDFETSAKATPVFSKPPFMLQSEALGYSRDKDAILVTSERRPSPLYRLERQSPNKTD